MPTEKEDLRLKNQRYNNTKRHRVYSKFATFFFSTDKFSIHFNNSVSSCLLLNKKQESANSNLKNDIIDMFVNNYNMDDIFN
jgi:hypothetical protein